MRRSQGDPTAIINQRKIDATKVVDTDSLVAKYEVLMKEHDANMMTEERSHLLFQVFDNLIPHLGVFKPVMLKLRDELYDFVFSDEHHTARASRMTNVSGSRSRASPSVKVERVPHYVLLKKLLQSRDNQADDLSTQVDTLQETLFTKQVEFEEAMATLANNNKESHSVVERISELESLVRAHEDTVRQLQKEVEKKEKDHNQTVFELRRQCDQLLIDCDEKDTDLLYLSAFKKGYDDLNEAFIQHSATFPSAQGNRYDSAYEPKDAVIATKKAHLKNDLQASKKLEEQVLTVMNTIIEQYDQFLEEQKDELAMKNLMTCTDILESRKIEREIDLADQELVTVEDRFKSSMEEINQELKLLRQHYSMLEEQLGELEVEQRPKPKGGKKHKKKKIEKSSDDPITIDEIRGISTNPDDYLEESYEEDPYIPHERIFSKYSMMLYYSQDAGKNYYIHQDCRYCESCHEKTIACPHKVLGESTIILMPHKVTHLKLKRPSVKIQRSADDDMKPPPTASSGLPVKMSASKRSAGVRSEWSVDADGGRQSAITGASFSSGTKLIQMKNSLQDVWKDYNVRTDMKRPIGRSLTLPRTLSVYEQFHTFIAWQDEYASEEDGYGSVLDNLYQFFGERYMKEEAQYAAAYDFLASIIQYSSEHRLLQLVAHSLVGNVDFAACRYILTLCNYIESIDWQDVEDFRAFAAAVYPSIQDEDLESIQMGYVSFSENKISKLHVFEYIMDLTLKGREPRIQDLEHQLMQYPSRELGLMNDEEFSEAADHLLQVPDEKMRRTLFSETLLLIQNTQPDVFHVHVSKLSCILAYLQLVEQIPKLDATIHEYIAENRPKHEESLGVHGHVVDVDPGVHLLNMAHIRNLSFNFAKRERCRKDRLAFEEDFM